MARSYEKGLLHGIEMGTRPTLATQGARGIRLRIVALRQRVKANLPIEFVRQQLTSYGGLELVHRYVRRLALRQRIEHAFAGGELGSDYGCGRLVLLVLTLRVATYRKHVRHETHRNFQRDLFSPDGGHFEYSAVTTNTPLSLAALWDFAAGRGAQEKTLAELKGEFALDVVPTNHYGANSAWQQLSILAHNLMRSFQLETLATPKPRSRKRTYADLRRSMRTLRFLLIVRAGRLARIQDRQVLRLTENPATQQLYEQVTHALAA